jgi:peroxiredoxin
MKRILMTMLASVAFIACSPAQDKAAGEMTLSGKIQNVEGNAMVTVEEISQNQANPVDTLELKEDGSFSTNLKVDEPSMYRINIQNRQFVPLILAGGDVNVVVDASGAEKPQVEGSEETDKLYSFSDLMNERQARVQEIDTEFRRAANEKDEVKMNELREEYMAYEQQFVEKLKKKIREMGVSVASFYAMTTLDWDQEFVFADSVTQEFKKKMPESEYTKALSERIEGMRATAIGSVAPEIALPNPDGEVVKLSSLRGNYVLLDFWAAWCGPCRRENPNVVRLYNKYNNKGFEVYGVSLDKTKEKWVQAIKDDNLSWTHVSDLKYFNSEAAQTYQVEAIPHTLLLDKEGRIIAKNLRGEALEAKLEEIFGE